MPNLPTSISEVLEHLDQIIERETQRLSPSAYFPILYREVTARVKLGIEQGRFDDGARMEKLDVIFANRYLEAYYYFEENKPVTRSWTITFRECRKHKLLIIQHLLLGINAHIDLDLGIAAATVAPGDQIVNLQNDFNKINDLLFELINEIQARLASISPLLYLLDWFGGDDDEKIAKFGLKQTRDHAWRLACLLASVPQETWPSIIDTTDKGVELPAKLIIRPRTFIVRGLLKLVSRWESKDVIRNIEALT